MTAEPVTVWQNSKVNGMALCIQELHDSELANVAKLRAQQDEYLASLPKTQDECIFEAFRVLHPGSGDYPEGFEEAFNLSFALVPMIRDLKVDYPGQERDALIYIANRIRDCLEITVKRLDRVTDILGNPARLEREGRRATSSNFPLSSGIMSARLPE